MTRGIRRGVYIRILGRHSSLLFDSSRRHLKLWFSVGCFLFAGGMMTGIAAAQSPPCLPRQQSQPFDVCFEKESRYSDATILVKFPATAPPLRSLVLRETRSGASYVIRATPTSKTKRVSAADVRLKITDIFDRDDIFSREAGLDQRTELDFTLTVTTTVSGHQHVVENIAIKLKP